MPEQQLVDRKPRFTRSFETQRIIEVLESVEVDKTVTYGTLTKAAGCRIVGGSSPLSSARRILQNNEGKVFVCVPGVGVKRATDEEIVQTGSQVVQHIHRTARRGMLRLACANFDALPQGQKQEFNAKASHLAILQHVTTAKSTKRITQAVVESQAKLPVEKTLEAFRNGKD